MNKTLSTALIFGLGVATGALIFRAWYKKSSGAEEEIFAPDFDNRDDYEEIIQMYDGALDDIVSRRARAAKEKPDIINYASKFRKGKKDTKNEEQETHKPRIISYDEFCADEEYDVANLIYYADKLLADEEDDLVEDIDNAVGFDFASAFDDETDIIYIRNDERKCYYEIVKDERSYMDDIIGQKI